jgi:hypothetical protein
MKVPAEQLRALLGVTNVNYVRKRHSLALIDSTLAPRWIFEWGQRSWLTGWHCFTAEVGGSSPCLDGLLSYHNQRGVH